MKETPGRKRSRCREVTVDRREAGLRLDFFLVAAFDGLSRKQAKRLIDGHRVSVKGRIEPMASRTMAAGERVRVTFPEPQAPPEAPSMEVLYEDADCLAVAKPAGIPSGPTRDASRPHAAGLAEAQAGRPLTLLHRLDKDTSGVLLLGKTPQFTATLNLAFRSRNVNKIYLAIVRGKPPPSFEAFSHLAEGEGGRMRVVRSGGMGAVTTFRTLLSRRTCALVEARPRTGRTHQIRIQLSRVGHPIVGDALYGGEASVRVRDSERPVPRQMLHARALSFEHPSLHRELTLEAPLPEDFRTLAEDLFGRLPLE